MAPPSRFQDLAHRLRRTHPMGVVMRRSLARLDHAPDSAIQAYQESRLRALVRLAAARSPFYRRWFAESGVAPASIRTLADLPRLPLLERHQLAEQAGGLRVYPRRLMWACASGGTSGLPVTTYRTPGSSAYELAAQERQWAWFGLPRGARRIVLRGSFFATDRPGALTREVPGGRQLLVSSFHLTPDTLPAILAAVRAYRPDAVEGWPSSIGLLAALMRDAGERLAVTVVITSSEVMNAAKQDLISEVFAAPIADHYGQSERVALAGGCEAGGYHVFPDYGIVELLAVPGCAQRWEVVGTPLHNWGFPLFRYRTGDQVGPAPSGPCPCGRAFPLLGRIDGREEDAFVAADGRLIPMPEAILRNVTGVRETQVAQHAPGRFEVRVVPGPGFDAAATEALARHNLERVAGQGQLLIVRTVDRIPRTGSGKLKPAVVLDGRTG